jgi:hypothetical protein
MTALNITYGTPTAYAVASSLSSANYDLTGTVYNAVSSKANDVLFEYIATVAANSTGNKQIVLFVQGSLDGTNWNALPSSTTDTTHETSMRLLGVIPTNGGAGSEVDRLFFSVAAAFSGVLPPYWRVIIKNDCGVALSSCSARTSDVTLSVV